MIHFFPRYSKTADASPLGQTLRALRVPHRIIATHVQQTFKYQFQLLLSVYPRLAWSALATAMQSLLSRSGPPPDAVVIGSDVEVLMFALVRMLPFAARPRIVFLSFIFTQRSRPIMNRLRLLYYRFVMRRVSCAICHSPFEIDRYRNLFAGCGTEFVFVPWGGYVPPAADVIAWAGEARSGSPRLVSAGRSGRDYPTLAAAAELADCCLTIICNELAALGGVAPSATIDVLSDCFGMDYLAQLSQADVVVVPLRVEDISAGQMVLIQAMALARPLIVTQTPTVGSYLQNGVNALLVPRGDAAAMAGAIKRLIDNPSEASAMGQRAQADYTAHFSIEAHLRAVIRAIEQHCGLETTALDHYAAIPAPPERRPAAPR